MGTCCGTTDSVTEPVHKSRVTRRSTRKTGDLYLVQRALGHRHITTTEIYARVGEEQLRRAVAVL